MDRDEPRFAQATWEMMERDEWFIPYFNEGYRFDKPVLTYWWMRVHYWIFGKSEFGARLHSVLSAWLTAVVILQIGTRFFSPAAGWWAAVGWSTCLQLLIHGRLCVADMPMFLGLTLSMWALVHLLTVPETPNRWGKWFWLLAGGQVFGFLAKGPICLAVPIASVLLARFLFYRKPLPWRRLQPLSFSLILLAGVGLWGIPALLETRGAYWEVGIGEHVVKRGTEAFNGRLNIPVVYYLVTGLLSLFPWSAFLPLAFARLEMRENPVHALLLAWFLSPLLIFAFYSTQLPHYIMPGFPAFFLLLFRGGLEPLRQRFRAWFWCVTGTIFVLSIAWIGAMSSLSAEGDLAKLRLILIIGGSFLAILALIALAVRLGRPSFLWISLIPSVVLLTTFSNALRSVHPVVDAQAHWQASGREFVERRAWFFQEPSLVFYAGHPWEWRGKPEEIATAAHWVSKPKKKRTAIFLLREWRLESQISSLFSNRGLKTEPDNDFRDPVYRELEAALFDFEIVRGLNVARSSWVELLIVIPKDEAGEITER